MVLSKMLLLVCFFSAISVLALGYSVEDYPWTISNRNLRRSYISAFRDHPSRNYLNISSIDALRDRLIVFIGDSFTRHQYLSLVHFLSSGGWNEDDGLPHSLMEKEFRSWPLFFLASNLRLGCHEILDAYRNDNDPHVRENRYFHHWGLNLTIYAFLHTSPYPIYLGRNLPTISEFHDVCTNREKSIQLLLDDHNNPTVLRQYTSTADFISKEITSLQPDVLILNQGNHAGSMFRTESNLRGVIEVMKSSARHAVWKTSTAQKGGIQVDSDAFVDGLVANGLTIFDAFSLTHTISLVPAVFWDGKHFLPFVYRELNLGLLDFLQGLLSGTSPSSSGSSAASASSTSTVAGASARDSSSLFDMSLPSSTDDELPAVNMFP